MRQKMRAFPSERPAFLCWTARVVGYPSPVKFAQSLQRIEVTGGPKCLDGEEKARVGDATPSSRGSFVKSESVSGPRGEVQVQTPLMCFVPATAPEAL